MAILKLQTLCICSIRILNILEVKRNFRKPQNAQPCTGHSSTTRLDQTGLETMKSLGRRIMSIYGYRILIFGLFEFIQTAANFAMPLLLSALLHYMEGTAKGTVFCIEILS